ncbi:hypothetical protein ACFSMW_00465 [Virgibacillus halophilus]|uniref:ABC-2 family transporter protein n=1 Tax=Tigheibacillus halophilus TaxID=361280 RepID=A0ABU5C1E9_9BACI|nr:hypothetical protein [Virgibacillus halophilus]
MSDYWLGLFMKEWKMMKGILITIFILAMLMLLFLDGVTAEGLMDFGLVITPFYVIYSLNTETNQIHLFLHQPNRANKIFLVKILTGLSFTAIFQLVLITIILIRLMLQKIDISHGADTMVLYLMYCVLSMLVISLFPTVVLLFAWNTYHWLKGMVGKLAFLIVVALTILGSTSFIYIWDTNWYVKLTHWGETSFSADKFKGVLNGLDVYGNFNIGVVLFHGVLVMTLYVMSCWLLDRKVGV